MRIEATYSGGELADFANTLERKNADVLSMDYGNTPEGGMSGLIYHKDLMEIFSQHSWFCLKNAHEDGNQYDSIDEYVWYAVEKNAEEILCHWAAREHIVQCVVCDKWEYTKDAYDYKDEYVCSRTCREQKEIEDADTEDDEDEEDEE